MMTNTYYDVTIEEVLGTYIPFPLVYYKIGGLSLCICRSETIFFLSIVKFNFYQKKNECSRNIITQ